jgi:P27 family predicted phage terminase small subunit
MSRHATPTARRLLEGNPGKRPINLEEPHPPPPEAGFDAPPPELDGHADAITEWARLAPMLRQAGQVTLADRTVLIAVCLEWDRYLMATREVAKQGLITTSPNGYSTTNPFLVIASKALAACSRLWPELGLTPSSRVKLKTSPLAPGADPFTEFDDQVQ